MCVCECQACAGVTFHIANAPMIYTQLCQCNGTVNNFMCKMKFILVIIIITIIPTTSLCLFLSSGSYLTVIRCALFGCNFCEKGRLKLNRLPIRYYNERSLLFRIDPEIWVKLYTNKNELHLQEKLFPNKTSKSTRRIIKRLFLPFLSPDLALRSEIHTWTKQIKNVSRTIKFWAYLNRYFFHS